MKKTLFVFLAVACLGVVDVSAQTTVRNPSAVVFNSADHATITGYEVDIVNVVSSEVVQTLQVAKASTTQDGADITIALNVQPIAFGRYVIRLRAVAGTIKSVDSAPSAEWERAPGPPSNVVVR